MVIARKPVANHDTCSTLADRMGAKLEANPGKRYAQHDLISFVRGNISTYGFNLSPVTALLKQRYGERLEVSKVGRGGKTTRVFLRLKPEQGDA